MALNILVVDDEHSLRLVIERVLKMSLTDVTVCTADGPTAALHLVAHGGFEPDLVLTDLQMPPDALDGIGLALRLRDHGFKKPIVLMTGKAFDGSENLRDINEVIKKPFDIDHLVSTIRKHLTG